MGCLQSLRNSKGFTLVELLIVVAIIGVLSTVGVPTFRRMIQKAKKSEAKINLGGLYTAESAFFSEFGAYGSNLIGIGFESGGSANQANYLIGFFTSACAPQTATADVARPLLADPIGVLISEQNSGYYVGGAAGVSTGGRSVRTANCGAASASGVTDDYARFVAAASGVIAPGLNRNNPGVDASDIWLIDHGRNLFNVQDGVGATSAGALVVNPTGDYFALVNAAPNLCISALGTVNCGN